MIFKKTLCNTEELPERIQFPFLYVSYLGRWIKWYLRGTSFRDLSNYQLRHCQNDRAQYQTGPSTMLHVKFEGQVSKASSMRLYEINNDLSTRKSLSMTHDSYQYQAGRSIMLSNMNFKDCSLMQPRGCRFKSCYPKKKGNVITD